MDAWITIHNKATLLNPLDLNLGNKKTVKEIQCYNKIMISVDGFRDIAFLKVPNSQNGVIMFVF